MSKTIIFSKASCTLNCKGRHRYGSWSGLEPWNDYLICLSLFDRIQYSASVKDVFKTCGWKKPFSSNSILTVLIFFFDIFSRKIFENQEVIYEDDVTSLYLACLTHSVLIFWFAFSQRISVDGKKEKKNQRQPLNRGIMKP